MQARGYADKDDDARANRIRTKNNMFPPMMGDITAQAVSEKKTFKNYTILYMYIAQGQRQIIPRGQNFDYN